MKEFDSNLQVKLLHKVYAYGWSYVFIYQSCMDWRLRIASLWFRGNCQVVFLVERSQLERTDPEIWSEISNGHWVVNKNAFPFSVFCSIGRDHEMVGA